MINAPLSTEPDEKAVVVYFIRPGGTIVPVDILNDDRAGSMTGSISGSSSIVEKPQQAHYSKFASRSDGGSNNASAESLFQRAWESGRLHGSDAAEQEALPSERVPEWILDNRDSRSPLLPEPGTEYYYQR